MAAAVGSLHVNIRARTAAFGRDIGKAKGMMGGFRASVIATTTSMAAMAAPFLGVALFAKLIKSSEDFNKAMNSSLAIMKDVSAVMREDMTKAAIEVSKTTIFSASEAAKAYFFLASAGLDAEQSLAAMPTVAKFAQAGMFDMALATDLLTDAQSALGLTVKDVEQNLLNMRRVGNVLVAANTKANASVQQFSEGLTGKLGPRIKALGKDVEEATAILAAFADQGIKGADASTAAAIVLRDLSSKAIQNAAAFRKARVAVFDANGEMRSTPDIILDLENRLKGMSDKAKMSELAMIGLTDKSVGYTLALIGTSEAMRKNLEDFRNTGEVMDDVAGKQMTPLQEAWEKLKGSFEETGISLSPLIAQFAELVNILTEAIEKARDLGVSLLRIGPFEFGDLKKAGLFIPEAGKSTAFSSNQAPPPPPAITEAERVAFAADRMSRKAIIAQELAREALMKAEKDAAKVAKELATSVEKMAKSLRTPFEVARDELMSLQKMRTGLGEELFGRGLEKLRNRFLPAPGAGTDGAFTAQAMQRGSTEAVKAIIKAQFGGQQRKTVEDKQLKELEAIRKLLGKKTGDKPQLVATIQP